MSILFKRTTKSILFPLLLTLLLITLCGIPIHAETWEEQPVHFVEREYYITCGDNFTPNIYVDESQVNIYELYFNFRGDFYNIDNPIDIESCGEFTLYISNGYYIDSCTLYVAPQKVSEINGEYSYDAFEIEWYENDSYVDGYLIYRSINNPDGEYQLLNDTYYGYYNDYDIIKGLHYYYKIQAYVETSVGTLHGEMSDIVDLYEAADTLKLNSVKADKANTLTSSWNRIQSVTGYIVYRSNNKDNGYEAIKTIINTDGYDDLTYSNKKLVPGEKYYYKISAFVDINGTRYIIKTSNTKSAMAKIASTKITSATSPKPGTNVIKWKKVDASKGYLVYRSQKRNSKYKLVKTIKNKNTLKYTQKNAVNGKAYYYKIVPYMMKDGKKVEGIAMSPYLKYCDYYTYRDEDHYSRRKRIFGNSRKTYFSNNNEAMANMKTITIKVWDIGINGKKYTRTFNITVHKKIAPSVKKMFAEIYRSKEKFPIHDIGCYSWRENNPGSEHCLGLAFDINSNENYMIDGNVIQAGSFWKPGVSPYSIPLKCDLVRILNKYGFTRGFWGYRSDYMHFSYFGC